MAYQFETVKLDKGMYSLGAVQGDAAGAVGCLSAAAETV